MLVATGHGNLAAYVDPAMVVLVSAAILRVPARLVADGLREILSMVHRAPPRPSCGRAWTRTGSGSACRSRSCGRPRSAAASTVEVDFLVGDESTVCTVADCDLVRQALHDRLTPLAYGRSMVVAFTAEGKWAQ